MTKPTALVVALFLGLGAAAASVAGDRPRAPVRVAARVVSGTVRHAHADGSVITLTFDENPASVRIVLLRGWADDFPADPVHYYLGKTVQVRGSVTRFRGVPEIVVRDADDIVVVGRAKAEAPAGSSLSERVKALSERLRLLEERVRELERREAERKSGHG